MNRKTFYKKVYEIAAHIPPGCVMTYAQIGELLGSRRYARMVGQAMSNAPEDQNLPCHRVVNSKGELAPDHVFGGKDVQRDMLLKEGVVFKNNLCIDLKKSMMFSPYGDQG
jgi:methylated-DNA-protein-cysteine methyltransferase-like protein